MASDLKSEPTADPRPEAAAADLKSEPTADLKSEPAADLKSEMASDLKTEPTAEKLPPPLQKNSVQYRANIAEVLDYLKRTGLIELNSSFLENIQDDFKSFLFNEKINGMTDIQKLELSSGIEILYDILFELRYYAIEGLTRDLYQVPLFFIGLRLGNVIKKIADLLINPSEESELDDTIRNLIEETAITDIVVNYEMSNLETDESELILTGKDLYQHTKLAAEAAKKAAKRAVRYKKLQKEKEKRKRESRRKRFKDTIKGR